MSTTKSVGICVSSTADGPVISQSFKIRQSVKGLYGCDGECKIKYINTKIMQPHELGFMVLKAAYTIKSIVCRLTKEQVKTLIEQDWLYCNLCRFAYHPIICPGKIRKFCPCCSTRLKFLRTVLKDSTVKKIQDTILISRMGKD